MLGNRCNGAFHRLALLGNGRHLGTGCREGLDQRLLDLFIRLHGLGRGDHIVGRAGFLQVLSLRKTGGNPPLQHLEFALRDLRLVFRRHVIVIVVRQPDALDHETVINRAGHRGGILISALLDRSDAGQLELSFDFLLPTGILGGIGVALVAFPPQDRHDDLLVGEALCRRLG